MKYFAILLLFSHMYFFLCIFLQAIKSNAGVWTYPWAMAQALQVQNKDSVSAELYRRAIEYIKSTMYSIAKGMERWLTMTMLNFP
jgi:hypothetical protein